MRDRGATRRMRVRGYGAAWTPASLPSLAAWDTAGPTWCFTDAAGTVPAGDGDLVRVPRNRVGNVIDVAQATSANRPTLVDAGGGFWVLRFDGVNDLFTSAVELWSPTTVTVGVAYRGATPGSSYRVLANSNPRWGMYLKDGVLMTFDFGAAADRSSGVNVADGAKHRLIYVFQSGVAGGSQLYADGVAAGAAFTATQNLAVFIGTNIGGASGSQNLAGDIGGVVVTGAAASAGDLANLDAYLNSLLP